MAPRKTATKTAAKKAPAADPVPLPPEIVGDARGWITFSEPLEPRLQYAEDSWTAADYDNANLSYTFRNVAFNRPATDVEIELLTRTGRGPCPPGLVTSVLFVSNTVRNRRWLALETATRRGNGK